MLVPPVGRRSGRALLHQPNGAPEAEAPVPEPGPRAAPLADREVFGFLPYWELHAASTRLDYAALSTIAYFGIGAHRNGYLIKQASSGGPTTQWAGWNSNRMTTIIDQAHANGVRVVLTVQRFAWGSGDAAETAALLSSLSARASLAADIAAAVRDRGADGVNLDFEPIPSGQAANFVAFVREVRAALDAWSPAYQLTFDATAYLGNYDVPALIAEGAADAVFVMGYDFLTGSAARTGATAPLTRSGYDLEETVDAYLTRTAPDRVILGLPWYGRAWSTTTDGAGSTTQPQGAELGSSSSVTYSAAIPRAVTSGRRYEGTQHSAWTAYRYAACPTCAETWRQTWYDDVDSLRAKYDLVAERGLRGAGIWALGYDDARAELGSLLRLVFRGGADTVAPTGAVSVVEAPRTASSRITLSLSGRDEASGSGLAYVRVSNLPEASGGVLAVGRTYPAATSLAWRLDDPDAGGSAQAGQRSVHVQWRDVAGNWSEPVIATIEFDAGPPTATVALAGGAPYSADGTVEVAVTQTGGRRIVAVRLSGSGAVAADGRLALGADVPYGSAISWSLLDPATGGSGAEGEREVFVQWQDESGAWSLPFRGSIVLDRTPPQVSPPSTAVVLGSFLTASGVPVRAAWLRTDAGSGIASSGLERSADGVAWETVSLDGASGPGAGGAMSVVMRLGAGRVHWLRARATDAAGLDSVTEADPVRVSLLEESAPTITYGGSWTSTSAPAASGGALRSSTAAGSTARLSFEGREVAVVARRTPTSGRARVYLDGVLQATIDLAAPAREPRMVVFRRSFEQSAGHVLKISVLGTSGRPRFDLDAFVVVD